MSHRIYEIAVDPDWGLRDPRDRIQRVLVEIPTRRRIPPPVTVLRELAETGNLEAINALAACRKKALVESGPQAGWPVNLGFRKLTIHTLSLTPTLLPQEAPC